MVRHRLRRWNSGPVLVLTAAAAWAQTAPTLNLQQAEQMALQNHPQIQAAQHEAAYSSQQVTINRSAYYPQITGDLTGTQGNANSRVGAGIFRHRGCSTGCRRARWCSN